MNATDLFSLFRSAGESFHLFYDISQDPLSELAQNLLQTFVGPR